MSDPVIICTKENDICQNGGVCVAFPASEAADNFCNCPENTAGARCGQITGPDPAIICTQEDDKCQNGGVCVGFPASEAIDNFCKCPENTNGARCEQVYDDNKCTLFGNECKNGGACVLATKEINGMEVEANYCNCPIGTYGDVCHNQENTAPSPPSQFDEAAKAAAEAEFAESASGSNTLEPICTETGGQCQNGGFCNVAAPGTTEESICVCPEGFTGNRCHSPAMVPATTPPPVPPPTNPPVPPPTAPAPVSAPTVPPGAVANTSGGSSNNNKNDIPTCTPGGTDCLNGAVCVLKDPLKNDLRHVCRCSQGFAGPYCAGSCTKSGTECKNGGVCLLASDQLNPSAVNQCVCPAGASGIHCETVTAAPAPPAMVKTAAPVQWPIPSVEDVMPTSKRPATCTKGGMECKNGGVCVLASDQSDLSALNYCQCPEGASGLRCEVQDSCELTCQNGGSCRHYNDITHDNSGQNSEYCECTGNYKGKECEIPFTKCPETESRLWECLYGGECTLRQEVDEYICACPEGRSGAKCEIGDFSTVTDWNGSCQSDVECKNGGLCVREHDADNTAATGMKTTKNTCLCSLGWGGDQCEFRCDTLNCQHGSSCRFPDAADITHANDQAEAGAFCECKDGWKGQECQIAVTKCPDGMQCLYGGACIGSQEDEEGDFYNCACPPSRMGKQCEKIDTTYVPYIPPPPPGSPASYTAGDRPLSGDSYMDPNIMVVVIAMAAFLAVIPITLVCLKKHREKRLNAHKIEEIQEENSDDPSAAATEETPSNSVANGDSDVNEDIFDYDTDGVVNVNLDENEPVPLPKDKQIV